MGCKTQETQSSLDIKIEVVNQFTFDEETKEHLFRIYSVIMHNPNREELAFANFTNPLSLVITDYQGKFIDKYGETGRGPEQFQSIRYFGFDDESNIVILDKALSLFKKFRRDSSKVTAYDYSNNIGASVGARNLQNCNGDWYLGIQLIDAITDYRKPNIGKYDSSFSLVDTLGVNDYSFEDKMDLMIEPIISVDCEEGVIYTSHGKVPFIQVFSMENGSLIDRSTFQPNSFMLSDKSYRMVGSPQQFQSYLRDEQSVSLSLHHNENYLFHIFRNEGEASNSQFRVINDSHHFVAVYDKRTLEFLGEIKLEGAILGSTKEGYLIMLKDEKEYEFQFLDIKPNNKMN